MCDHQSEEEHLNDESDFRQNTEENENTNSENFVEPNLEGNDLPENEVTPFAELLKTHSTQMIWGFQFGEKIQRCAQKKMIAARINEETKLTKIDSDSEIEPSSSQIITEINHKTPHSLKRQYKNGNKRKFKATTEINLPKQTRNAPLPLLDFADSVEVWNFMIYKEEDTLKTRNSRLFEDCKNFTPRMRAILLDWLMEVCEVYHLRRVTYYLSVDYFDRFVSIRSTVPKNQLQLVGITCLFISAKVEEVYPPNITEFAYVCDGACTVDDILACELLILNTLGWEVILTTPTDWLNLYMQLHFKAPEVIKQKLHVDINKNFIFPQYSGYQFIRASQLMDIFSLDPGYLKFRYSIVAASAMYFMYGKKVALAVSGLTWEQLRPCADYMSVFFDVIKNATDPKLRSYLGNSKDETDNGATALRVRIQNLVKDENYSIQTHVASMEYFEQAAIIRLSQMTKEFIDKVELPELVENGENSEKSDEKSEPTESDIKSNNCSDTNEICDELNKLTEENEKEKSLEH